MSTQQEGTAPQQPDFDPKRGVISIPGKGKAAEYLPVNWRVYWLRQEHPDARIVTEIVQLDPDIAIFKATVTLPSGAVATGFGSQTPKQFPSYIEKSETKAIGRALAAMGYGTLAAFLEDDDLADAPVERPAPRQQRPTPLPVSTAVVVPSPYSAVPLPDAEFATVRNLLVGMIEDGLAASAIKAAMDEQKPRVSEAQFVALRQKYAELLSARKAAPPPPAPTIDDSPPWVEVVGPPAAAPGTRSDPAKPAQTVAIQEFCRMRAIPLAEALGAGRTLETLDREDAGRIIGELQRAPSRNPAHPQAVSQVTR